MKYRRHWAALCCLGLALPALLIDLPVARFALENHLPGDLRKMVSLSEVFAHGFGVALIFVCLFVLDSANRRSLPRLIAATAGAGLLVNGIKLLVGRWRPRAFDFEGWVGDTFVGWLPGWQAGLQGLTRHDIQSFPSGHTATAVALALGLAWLYPRGRLLFASLAVLAALQRIESARTL